MKQTVNYNLNVPGENTVVNIDDLNYNTQVIDRELFLKANKSDLPRDLNDLNVAEGWQTPAGDVVRGLQNFKADITYVDDGIEKIKEQIDEEVAKQASLNQGYNRNIADLKRYKADTKYVDEQIKEMNLPEIQSQINQKVDKEYGKGLSTNDFDDWSKNQVNKIQNNQGSISDKNEVNNKTTDHTRVISASVKSTAANVRTGVLASIDVENYSNTSAMIACSNSKLIDSDSDTSNYRRNMVMLASDGIEFDSANANDHKVIGGYKGKLGWVLDSREGMIEARNDIVLKNKKLSSLSKSSTIVIANYDSHKNSKESADILVNKGEDAAKKINEAIQSLKTTGGEVKLMEGTYELKTSIDILVDNVSLTGIYGATKLITSTAFEGNQAIINIGGQISVDKVKISNLSVMLLGSSYCRGILLSKATNIILYNLEVLNCNRSGITLYDSSSATMTNIQSYKNEYNGIVLYGSSSATMTNIQSYKNEYNGISLYGSSSATMTNVSCFSNNMCNKNYSNILLTTTESCILNSCYLKSDGNVAFGLSLTSETSKNIINNMIIKGQYKTSKTFDDGTDNKLTNIVEVD